MNLTHYQEIAGNTSPRTSMSDANFTDLTAFITREGGELITDTRAVAIAFGKRHADVMRNMRGMAKSAHPEVAEHYRRNFALVDFADAKGERRPMYRMTAKGLGELTMSFTGDKARVVRIRFLNAFEAVAQRLANAERTITDMLHAHDKRDAVSVAKARIGSLLMHGRRKEKPALADEKAKLDSLVQPSLLN